MLKKLSIFCAVAICGISLAADVAATAQTLPKQGYVTLASGDYTVTFLPTSNYRISGFAFQGKELFLSRGSASGTNITPAAAEKLVSAKITVDDTVPSKVTYAPVKGNKVVLERESIWGDVRLFVKYTVTATGLQWSIKYKLDSANKRPSYFYLYTMAWSNKTSEFMYSRKGAVKTGKLTGSGAWVINGDVDYMALYNPAVKLAAVTKMITDVPGEMRKNAIWDHKSYHKYFMMHKRPAWKAGYESPEYIVEYSAVAAEPDKWCETVQNAVTAKGK